MALSWASRHVRGRVTPDVKTAREAETVSRMGPAKSPASFLAVPEAVPSASTRDANVLMVPMYPRHGTSSGGSEAVEPVSRDGLARRAAPGSTGLVEL